MTGVEFTQLQEALMYVFYPIVSWFLAFVMLTGFVAGLLAFFLGHELGDLGWYMVVSTVMYFGGRAIPRGVIGGLLAACGVVIIGFGAYLGISPFLSK